MSQSNQLSVFTRDAGVRSTSASLLFGQVMFLVAVAIGFFAGGAFIGRDLTYQTGFACEIAAIVMLFAQSFVRPLRAGTLGTAWLYGLALLLGIGLGPVINHYATYDPTAVYQAGGGTALTVAAMGSFGMATSRDLQRWARPLFFAFLGVILVGWVLVLVGSGGNIVLNIAVYVFASAFLAINFQYLRRSADASDAVWIATGIFVNVINIFLTLLQLFGNSR